MVCMGLSLTACGLIKDKKKNSSDEGVVKILKPSDSDKIDQAQLATLFKEGTFFQVSRGLFSVTESKHDLTHGSQKCTSTETTQSTVIKVDGDHAYLYINTSAQGGTSYVVQSDGSMKLQCTSKSTNTVKVQKVKMPKTFAEFTANLQKGASVSGLTLYKVGNNLEVLLQYSPEHGSGEGLLIYENPNEVPGFIGMTSGEWLSETEGLQNNQTIKTTSHMKETRKTYGNTFPLDSLYDTLLEVRYCVVDDTTLKETCEKDPQDLTYLL